ncbi:substrate-binding periplasmic protein [Agaribacterium haliotis]|uniref:substrate-binding periplasmic protein n=1 Tax=Agaribacterium haliotis TaxID=2013869 RepID=UPI000BB56745|nr:transporter substrate-binding domain-containing protein [Agaribacterium haliotis]
MMLKLSVILVFVVRKIKVWANACLICRRSIISVACITAFSLFGHVAVASSFKFAATDGLFAQQVGRYMLPCIYRELGHEISIVDYPAKRALSSANSGSVDGEVMRIYDYGDYAPNTVRVPTPYYYVDTTAFFLKDKAYENLSLEEIKKLKVVKVRGVTHTDFVSKDFAHVKDVDSTEQLFLYLQAGRADVALTNASNGLHAISLMGLEDTFSKTAEPLDTQALYHYIHKSKSAELVTKVDTAIKKLIDKGFLQQLAREAELRLYSGAKELHSSACSSQELAADTKP